MFLRIVKNSLKRKKLMNITLFLFIFISAIIVCICSAEIYYATAGLDHTFEMTNTADYTIMAKQPMREVEEINGKIASWANEADYITAYHQEDMIYLNYKQIDFVGVEEEDYTDFIGKPHYLGTLPSVHNKVYDLNDQSFELGHGEIAIASSWANTTHTQIGDEIRITTDMGNTYSFKVSHMFKDVLFPIGALSTSKRYFVSDVDYAQLLEETPIPMQFYTFNVTSNDRLLAEFENYSERDKFMSKPEIIYSYVMQNIMVVILLIVSIFLIVIILLTLNFNIKASLIEDEKEIGMMRAIGLPALQFKGLYIANYTFLTVIGAICGLIVGLPVARYVTSYFAYNLIPPSKTITYSLAILAVIMMSLLIILFCFLCVRKIDKVSAIVALGQGLEGETSIKQTKMSLYRKKKMKVPQFLALKDIRGGFKQYIVLMCAYFLGTMLLLFPQHVLHTIQSPSYLRYWDQLESDFSIHYYSGDLSKIYKDSLKAGQNGTRYKMFSWMEEKAKEQGIEIDIEVSKAAYYNCFLEDGGYVQVPCNYGPVDTHEFEYAEGMAPEYENEIAVGANMAKRYKLQVGQPLWMEIKDYNDEKTAIVKEKKEFFITGIYQTMNNEGMAILMGNEFESGVMDYSVPTRMTIYASEEEKPMIINELKEIFGARNILTNEEYLEISLADFISLFTGVIIFVNITVMGVLFFMTLLYTRVIMSKEISSLALLKQTGFTYATLTKWQLIRIGLLTSGPVILGCLGSVWLGQPLASICFEKLVGLTSFIFEIHPTITFIQTPVLVFGIVFLATAMTCRRMKHLKLYDISGN